ncbi:MAG: hypothetical protein EXS37_18830 [Opitutus sp.]|nr:hypothetical protein [Opitutus sp.]
MPHINFYLKEADEFNLGSIQPTAAIDRDHGTVKHSQFAVGAAKETVTVWCSPSSTPRAG